MSKTELIDQVSHIAFQGLGFQMTLQSLDHSFIGIAWCIGLPRPAAGWQEVNILYHYEEAIALIFIAMEAELIAGYLTTIMKAVESELKIPALSSDLSASDVLGGMVKWSYAHASHRAHVAGSVGKLSLEEANTIFDHRASNYTSLVEASAQNKTPITIPTFELGISRDHPWNAFACDVSDNICDLLSFDRDGLEGKLMQLAVSQKRTAFYRSVIENLS